MRRFGCTPENLERRPVTPSVRGLLAFEVQRAHLLLDSGVPLVRTLRGRAAIAVAAFVAGGRAALRAIERTGYDVLGGAPRASTDRPRAGSDRHRGAEPAKMSTTTTVAWAYRHCEEVTRTEAANFYYGIRLLPADKRRAMCAVYASLAASTTSGTARCQSGRSFASSRPRARV